MLSEFSKMNPSIGIVPHWFLKHRQTFQISMVPL